jgi:hypothetical protein
MALRGKELVVLNPSVVQVLKYLLLHFLRLREDLLHLLALGDQIGTVALTATTRLLSLRYVIF